MMGMLLIYTCKDRVKLIFAITLKKGRKEHSVQSALNPKTRIPISDSFSCCGASLSSKYIYFKNNLASDFFNGVSEAKGFYESFNRNKNKIQFKK
jgi:hypothetical protein